jgi:hypothetical protein
MQRQDSCKYLAKTASVWLTEQRFLAIALLKSAILLLPACRAERFGTQYHDPAKLPKFAQEARKERFRREGFATGIDLFSEVRAAAG